MINYSFIIPHHNAPELLQRCVDSIPVREDVQIIVVDDNSDEGEKPALQERKGLEVVMLDASQSKGAGRARNVGIKNAKGKWLLFADADDLYKEKFMGVLDEYKDKDIDILFFNIDSVDSQTLESLIGTTKDRSVETRNIIDAYTPSNKDVLLFQSYGPWNKMILKDVVSKYGLYYEEVYKGNDVMFSLEIGSVVKKYAVDKRTLYSLTYYPMSLTYKKMTSSKYISYIHNTLHKAYFNNYIGHPEWNKIGRYRIGKYAFLAPLLYVLGLIKTDFKSGISAMTYYLRNLRAVYKDSKKYVNVVKTLSGGG